MVGRAQRLGRAPARRGPQVRAAHRGPAARALTLVAAVPLGARLAGRRVSAVEWRGTGLTLLGLGALLLTASGPTPDDVLSVTEAVAVSGATAVLIGLLCRPGARPGLRHATASGIASGVASALTQTVTVAATDPSGPC